MREHSRVKGSSRTKLRKEPRTDSKFIKQSLTEYICVCYPRALVAKILLSFLITFSVI